MEWKDIYLDKNITGYLILRTLSKQKVMNTIEYSYKGHLHIEEKDIIKVGECLALQIHDNDHFADYIDLYKQILRISSQSLEPLENIMKIRNTMIEAYRTRLDAAIIGTTQWSQSFLIKMNIRHAHIVMDIYFQNGKSYYEDDGEIFVLDETNLYDKIVRMYKMEDKKNE